MSLSLSLFFFVVGNVRVVIVVLSQVADRLASDHHPGQLVVVCGTNARTKEALEGHSWPKEGSGVTVRVLGFVSNMDEWMSAADLLVTKVRSKLFFFARAFPEGVLFVFCCGSFWSVLLLVGCCCRVGSC